MNLVASREDLEENFSILHSAVKAGDDSAIDLIKKGKSIVVGSFGGEIAFGPSKFLGYTNNTIDQHLELRLSRDGRDTDRAIAKTLGFEKSINSKAETAFAAYCESLSVSLPANKRGYWVLPSAQELVEVEVIVSDELLSNTEKIALVKSRIGQGRFRSQLESKWNAACCITGCKVRSTLRASHIKPWKSCNNIERLDVDNGLLLVANADALFDAGLISFSESGALLHSGDISRDDLNLLIGTDQFVIELNESQQKYMEHHRETNGYE